MRAMPVPGRSLEKTAFWGTALRAARRLSPSGLASATRPVLRPVEQAATRAAQRMGMSPTASKQLFRNSTRAAVSDAASGSLIGGTFSGGINALTAEPGERGDAFLKGFGSGALSGAGYGALTGLGGKFVRNASGMRLQNFAKRQGLTGIDVGRRSKDMGFFKTIGTAFKAPNAADPAGKVNQGIARAKLLGGLGLFGAEVGLSEGASAVSGAHDGGTPPPPPPQSPQFQPNAPAVYSQPQYYKSSSVKTQLRPIDFTKLSSYHK